MKIRVFYKIKKGQMIFNIFCLIMSILATILSFGNGYTWILFAIFSIINIFVIIDSFKKVKKNGLDSQEIKCDNFEVIE